MSNQGISEIERDIEKKLELTPEEKKKARWVLLIIAIPIIIFIIYGIYNPENALLIIVMILAICVGGWFFLGYLNFWTFGLVQKGIDYYEEERSRKKVQKHINRRDNKSSPNVQAHPTHSCPKCNSPFITVYEDGSGLCHQCEQTFQNAKPNK